MHHPRAAFLFPLALSLSGCAHFGGFHVGAFFAHAPAALGRVAIAPVRVAVAPVRVASAAAPAVVTALAATRGVAAIASPGQNAAQADLVPADPVRPAVAVPQAPQRFDATAARASLEDIDLASPCLAHGVPHGYLHARVTFVGTGRVARIDVDGPDVLSREALSCVGAELGRAAIRPFSGSIVVVGVTLFVR